MVELILENIHIKYDDFLAVDGVNLTIKDSTGKDIKKTILNYVINGAGEILWTKVVGNMTDNGKAISIIYYGDK